MLLRNDDSLADPAEMGLIVETAVAKHLFSFYYRATPRFGYWRDAKTEKEVGFIVALPNGRHIMVEVKYAEAPAVKTSDGLYLFARDHPAPEAFVITKDAEDFGPLPELETARGRVRPFRIPAFLFLYLLGAAERSGPGA